MTPPDPLQAVQELAHSKHTVWKDGIDLEECTQNCAACLIAAALETAHKAGYAEGERATHTKYPQIDIRDDGTWITFAAPNQPSARLRLETIAEDRGHIIGGAIALWCEYVRALPVSGITNSPAEQSAVTRQGEGSGIGRTEPEPLCMDCDAPYGGPDWIDTTLPHEQWKLIHNSEGGILCANCIVRRAAKLPKIIVMRARLEFAGNDSPANERKR